MDVVITKTISINIVGRNMLRKSFLKHGFLFLICLCLGTGMIWAQEESASAESSSAMEEMIVTAQRVEENIQDVPISVTALDEIALELQQVITPSDLQMSVPNLSFTSQNFLKKQQKNRQH